MSKASAPKAGSRRKKAVKKTQSKGPKVTGATTRPAMARAVEAAPPMRSPFELADAARERGEYAHAINAFRTLLYADPRNDEVLLGLARSYADARDLPHAFGCLEKLVERSPDFGLAWRWLGEIRHRLGRDVDAIAALDRALELMPGDGESLFLRGAALLQRERLNEALENLHEAVERLPRNVRAQSGLAHALAIAGRADEARAAFERTIELEPNSLAHHWGRHQVVPLVYRDEVELASYRDPAVDGLRALTRMFERASPSERAKFGADALLDNFRFHYQGVDVTELQALHGNLVYQIVSARHPELTHPVPLPPRRERLRVGFASSCFRTHTVLELFERWLCELDRERFEVFVYQTGIACDKRTKELAETVEHFHFEPYPLLCASKIREDQLDALIFPEIGMDRNVLILAACRLAPLQLMTCGHPVTSGLPTVDVFLSGELVEPQDGDSHYHERLIRLPGTGMSLKRPAGTELEAYDSEELDGLRATTRTKLGLPVDRPLLFGGQMLFKYLPQRDDVFARIAERAPEVQFVFLRDRIQRASTTFDARLERAFAARGLDVHAHVKHLSRLDHASYLALNQASDLFLDSFDFSAGRSGFEAIACGLVPVTCPGAFARARYLSAALRQMGVEDTITQSEDEWVERVVELVRDPVRRRAIRSRLIEATPRLFEGRTELTALEGTLEALVMERRARAAMQR